MLIKIQEILDQDSQYPESLKQIKKPPKKLYVIGDSTLLSKASIGIVGSRDATEYGKEQTKQFAKSIASSGICVISGLAMRY